MMITIDDSSPQINYFSENGPRTGSKWRSANEDPATDQCFKQSFTGTNGDGDRMQLRFNGSAIWVYGSKWFNHGAYTVQLDDLNLATMSGTTNDRLFQQELFRAGGLPTEKEHILTIQNTPRLTAGWTNTTDYWLDIDYIVIEQPINTTIYTMTIDDTSSLMRYSQDFGPYNIPHPDSYNQTSHITFVGGTTVSFPFNGSSIQIYGPLNMNHGNYSVSVDGFNTPLQLSGELPKLQTRAELYTLSGLNDGPHTIQVTNRGSGDTAYFEIDYVVVNSTINPNRLNGTGTDTYTSSPGSSSSNSSSTPVNVGAIAGGVVGGVLALALIGVLLWYLRRKRRLQGNDYDRGRQIDILEGEGGGNGDEIKPYRIDGSSNNLSTGISSNFPVTPNYNMGYSPGLNQPSSDSSGIYNEGNISKAQGLSPQFHAPPPPASNATSYPMSMNPPSSVGAAAYGMPQSSNSPMEGMKNLNKINTSNVPSSSGSQSIGGDPSTLFFQTPVSTTENQHQSFPTGMSPPAPASSSSSRSIANTTPILSNQPGGPNYPRDLKASYVNLMSPTGNNPPSPEIMEEAHRRMSSMRLNETMDGGEGSELDGMNQTALHRHDTLPPNYEQAISRRHGGGEI